MWWCLAGGQRSRIPVRNVLGSRTQGGAARGHRRGTPGDRPGFRLAPGCLDSAITRLGHEGCETQAEVEAFRGSGPSDEHGAAMLSASVAEYDVAGVRSLT